MKALKKYNYNSIRNSIRAEFDQVRGNVEDVARKELVAMYWRIGKMLNEQVMEADLSADERAETIRSLTRDFNRGDTKYFYSIAKFQRLYPVCPDNGLYWTHYKVLIAIDDKRERARLEKRIEREHIKPKQFQFMMGERRRREKCRVELIDHFGDRPVLAFSRGELYYYRMRFDPELMKEKGRAILDLGFGIDREVECDHEYTAPSGIAHVRKEGLAFTFGTDNNRHTDLYTYKAVVTRVIDGDTLQVRVDLGFYTWIEVKVRLRGIDCPERESIVGIKAKEFVERQVKSKKAKGKSEERTIVVRTYKREKYGRYLADVFYSSSPPFCYAKRECGDRQSMVNSPEKIAKDGVYLNQELLDKGLAKVYK